MHDSGFPFDLNHYLFQFIFTVFVIVVGILHLVKTTASKYFVVDANFEEGGEGRAGGERERQVLQNRFQNRNQMVAVATSGDGCAVCGKDGIKKCSRCKHVRYCSTDCQTRHWKEGHSKKCQELKSFGGLSGKLGANSCGLNASICDNKSGKEPPQLKKVLFPYEDFVKFFNWENMGFRPSGLLNCGNSCYANVVLQCLSCTRPLVAYLLEIGHEGKCKRNDWCFLCELQHHVHRARNSWQPFSPINILSRLPNIGGNLGYGKQEDAHEFMRFAIDTMQSVCLDEFGGEKALHPISQETTLIQYIFGGHLQSQVKCSKCNKISYRHENMMDLTVEIQGEAESLEECLDQFTAEEWLDGDNMYKCEGCNDYVRACKRLAIHYPPNILTIALKRFQSGRFGKLNKRVTFPETLDLGPYMSTPGYGTDIYRLYAVVVHIDMLNASYFGHYICYTKDFCGNWYRIDDCKVTNVELEEVLSQGAYMLLYSRMCARQACVKSLETCKEEKRQGVEEAQRSSQAAVENASTGPSIKSLDDVGNTSIVILTPEEEKRGVDVVEEVQPCFGPPVQPTTVEDSITSVSTIATDVRCPAMELSSEMDDLVHMDLDDPFEVNGRSTREDLTVAIADIPIEPESGLLDMDADGPIEKLIVTRENQLGLDLDNSESSSLNTKLDDCETKHSDATVLSRDMDAVGPIENLMVTRENRLGLDLDNSESCSLDMKLDDHESKHPDATGVSLDINPDGLIENQPGFDLDNSKSSSLGVKLDDCGSTHSDATGVSSLVPLSEACPIVEAHSSATDSEDDAATDSKDNQLPVDNGLASQSDVHELPETSCSFSSDMEILQEGEPSSFHSLSKPNVEQVSVISAAQLSKGKSWSKAKQKPLLSRGFLDKRPRCRSSNKTAAVMLKRSEVGVSSNCNGFIAAERSVEVNSRFTGDESKGIEFHSESVNGHSLRSAGDKSCSLFAPVFLNKRTRCNSPTRNGKAEHEMDEISSDTEMLDLIEGEGLSSKMSNGTVVSHGSYDKSSSNGSLLENGKHSECQQISMDEDDVKVGDPLKRFSNGNNGCNSFDKMGNGKAVFSRGFLNKPPHEVSNLREIVSSNHDKNINSRGLGD